MATKDGYFDLISETPCSSSVGLETLLIPAERVTASSSLSNGYLPTNGRLGTHLGFGSWCAATHNDQQFLQIDLRRAYKIHGFATQGKNLQSNDGLGDARVTSYKVLYSQYGVHWSSAKDSDGSEVITNTHDGTYRGGWLVS